MPLPDTQFEATVTRLIMEPGFEWGRVYFRRDGCFSDESLPVTPHTYPADYWPPVVGDVITVSGLIYTRIAKIPYRKVVKLLRPRKEKQ